MSKFINGCCFIDYGRFVLLTEINLPQVESPPIIIWLKSAGK